MELVSLLSTGKGTWGQTIGLIKRGGWSKIIIIGDKYVKKTFEKFGIEQKIIFVDIDMGKGIKELIKEIKEKLKGKIEGTEVALSIASGSGKEHMALISALIQLPVGIKFAVLTKEGVEII
jgi:uncharacterized protein YajQ (UPF0234 family)